MRQGFPLCPYAHQSRIRPSPREKNLYKQTYFCGLNRYVPLKPNQNKALDKTSRKEQQKQSRNAPAKLGDCLLRFMQGTVEPKTEQYQALCQIWEKIVPENLKPHCRIVESEGGTVKVQADSSSFIFELRMNSRQMLRQIQNQCPALRIKNLKFIAGQQTRDDCS
jgi:hypothetical protein